MLNLQSGSVNTGYNLTELATYVSHTQGSGKSLTMLWFELYLKRKYSNATILIATNRKQLDERILQKFQSCGFPNPEQAEDKEDLKTLLANAKGSK